MRKWEIGDHIFDATWGRCGVIIDLNQFGSGPPIIEVRWCVDSSTSDFTPDEDTYLICPKR